MSGLDALDVLWRQYQARASGRPLWQQPEPLVCYRFMLEACCVSVLAQQLARGRCRISG